MDANEPINCMAAFWNSSRSVFDQKYPVSHHETNTYK